jgi:hypothetical protein
MVHRCILEPQGVTYRARRPREDETTEFLTSTEQWFRPVNLMTGPDGALYVVDMYRAIIEDYSAIPRFLQQQYIESLIAGSDRGRIWKIVADGAPPPRKIVLAEATPTELVAALSSPNAWWRETAQRLLVERGDRSAARELTEMAASGGTPQARLHALYTLDGLSALTPETVRRALGDEHFAVRMHALVLTERWLQEDSGLFEAMAALADDSHPRVRLQAALTLGQSRSPAAAATLAKLAAASEGDSWLQAAILSSAAETAADLLVEVVQRAESGGSVPSLLRPLVSIVGARHRNDEISRALAAIETAKGPAAAGLQSACLSGLAEGLNRG